MEPIRVTANEFQRAFSALIDKAAEEPVTITQRKVATTSWCCRPKNTRALSDAIAEWD